MYINTFKYTPKDVSCQLSTDDALTQKPDSFETLLELLRQMVQRGNTVIVIEHRQEMIAAADWIIDLGPEGGHQGGEILFTGTPEQLVLCERSVTGRYLRRNTE